MAQVIWSPASLDELQDLIRVLNIDTPAYASSLTGRLFDRVSNLESFPEMGRLVIEDDSKSHRELIVDNYRVIYRYEGNLITIVSIIHGARLLQGW